MTISPENEAERLSALQNYQILDTEPEDLFNDLTELAASICGAPTALVSLFDGDRQWFKSRVGLAATEMPRENAFCAHTILNPEELFVVEDAAQDARFCDNPMVTGEPRIRFYAGAPLVSPEGFALGSLCVIDYVPRRLSAEQLNNLKLLAGQVVSQMELRKSLKTNAELAERCRQAILQASDGIHLFDFEGRITTVNKKFCELTGRSEAELLKLRVEDLIPPEDLDELPTRFEELQSGKTRVTQRRLVRPDGSLVNVEVSSKKFDDNTIQAIVRDVTERKIIEKKLSDSEIRFRDFVNNSLALFCTHDLQGTIESVNPAAADALGYAESELVGKSLADILLAETIEMLPAYLAQIKTGGEVRGFMQVVTKNGEHRIWSYSNVLCGTGENCQYVLGSAQDITELKRGEDELKKSQKRFNLFIDNSPAVIFLKNEDGRYVTVNRSFEALFQVRREDLKGKTDFEFFPPEIAESICINDRSVLETGETLKAVEFVPTPDGTPHYWLSNKFLIEDGENKKFVGGIAVDITERKQMEDDLHAARDAALESVRLKSAFLTNVSHEIRTPMNGVLGMTELLLDTPLDRAQRDYAETIRQSGDALLTVINDILDLAKIEAGKLRFETVDFDVRETIESTVEMLAGRAFGKNIEIASLIDTKVPRILRGDPGRLRQVLTNLVGNAVKFTESGGVRVEANVREEKAGQTILRFDVIDTGIGITEKNLKNLFQPFVQVDNSTTRQFGGTGLGLVISKQIVGMMNGEISVESELNKGSRFSFTARFANKPASTEEKTASPSAIAQQLNGKRILIADASAVICVNLEQYCRIWNLTVCSAANGEEALRKLRKSALENRPFDFVVIDLNLPDWDGFSLVQRIKTETDYASPRIIVTTAYGQRGDAAEAQKIGVAGYLTKPVRGSQLLECLSAVLTESGQSNHRADNFSADLITRHSLREAKTEKETIAVPKSEKPFRVLVVEDNEVNRRVVLEQLKRIGVVADFAVDGVDALEKTAAQDYELIFMDCQMPRMDGYEATRQIRLREREKIQSGEAVSPLVVIALTAHTLAGEREKCFVAGMNDYLAKPAKISELSMLLRYWQETLSPDKNLSAEDLPQLSTPFETAETKKTFSAYDLPSDSMPNGNAFEDEFDKEIIRLYITETTGQIEKIEKALRRGDCAAIARCAHAARGNSLAVGESKIAAIAARIEELGDKNEIEQIPVYMQNLNREFSYLMESCADRKQ